MYIVMISGSRLLTEQDVEAKLLDALTSKQTKYGNDLLIIHGGAQGVDLIAEKLCKQLHIPTQIFRPNYQEIRKQHNENDGSIDHLYRLAPLERNLAMIQQADEVIVIWDGTSHGTKHVIEQSIKQKKKLTRIVINSHQSKFK